MKELKKKAIKRSILFAAVSALAASMTFTLYPIITFLLSNQGEFWFPVQSMIWPTVKLFFVVAGAVFLLLMLFSGSKMRNVMLFLGVVLAVLDVCYYIQSSYMVSYLPLLTGDAIDWSQYGLWGVLSHILWCGVSAGMLALFILRREKTWTWVMSMGAVLFCMESLVLGITFATVPLDTPSDDSAYCSAEGLYELSDQGNVVMIVSDTFEGTFMNSILEQYPEWRETLKDFVYYDNTTGTSCFTYFSFAKLLTGVDFPIGMDSSKGVETAFCQETLISQVAENDWDIAYYTLFQPTPNVSDKLINYEGSILLPDSHAKQSILKLLMRSTLFKGVPHQLKNSFIVLDSDYRVVQGEMDIGDKAAPYVLDDNAYRSNLLERGMTAVSGRPRYVLYEMNGVHAPYTINRSFETVEFDDSVTLEQKQIEAGLASLNLLTEYVNELKKADLYDNTTIIFTADHGFNLRFYPVMLVKEASVSHDELITDSIPLSFQEDYEKILDSITKGKSFSESVEDLNISANRVRYALNFRSKDGYGKDTGMRSKIEIAGLASDEASYHTVKDEFSIDDSYSGRYVPGKSFEHTDSARNVAAYGFRDSSHSLYSHSGVLDVWFKEAVEAPLTYETQIQNLTDVDQTLIINICDKEVASYSIAPGEIKPVSITIAKEMIKNNRVTLYFEAPNALLNHGEVETLGWSEYRSIGFSSGVIR